MKSVNIAYLPRLDHLRFVAAGLVIAFHVYHYFYHGWQANPEAAAIGFIVEGHTGVGLFFTLSGFLFMLIGMNGAIDYKTFLYNRVLRIAPLFIVVFYLAISLGRNDFSAGDIGYLLFSNIGTPPTSNFFITGAAWTISVEFTFYLIFPFLCRFFLESGYRYVLGLLALMLVFKICAYLIVDNPIHVLYSTLIGRLDQFLIGMAAGRYFHDNWASLRRRGWPLMIAATLLMYAALWILARHASWSSLDKHQPLWIVWSMIEAGGWALVILGYLSLPTLSFSGLSGRLSQAVAKVAGYCGKISFSLYLLHAIVLYLLKELIGVIQFTPWFFANYLINLGVVMVLCVALASLGFYFIESPFLKLRKRYVVRDHDDVSKVEVIRPIPDVKRAEQVKSLKR
nr:acyltransferase [uncultured Halomonas sp.]